MQTKRKIGTIDLTPTWRGALPYLITALIEGTPEGQRLAKIELKRVADLADLYNASPRQDSRLGI